MKARVKATGDIIEVERVGMASDIWALQSDITVVFNDAELDINIEPDYWEKLKHQYAGMAMQGILANCNHQLWERKTNSEGVAKRAYEIATALVNKLMEESQHK